MSLAILAHLPPGPLPPLDGVRYRRTVPDIDPLWTPSRGERAPDERTVDVWAIALTVSGTVRRELEALLAPDERSRADRLRFPRDRERFVVARGALRTILGAYTGERPERLLFDYGARGKPALAGPAASKFNLSHSHEIAVCAAARRAELGVDVEHVRAGIDAEAIVERFFSTAEREAFRALPPLERPRAFFRLWTRKEAYQKSRGEGFFRAPGRFTVTVPPEPPRLVQVDGEPAEAERWSMRELEPAAGYVATVAFLGAGFAVRRLRFQS
jgi:4'-phosphopantetheinyl transferase